MGGGTTQLLMFAAIFAVFYFFMIRPQARKQKEEKKFRDNIKSGDKVITIGGIHGKIVSVNDTNVILEVESGQKIKVEKSALMGMPARPDEKK
ncbi:MAG: preprotein translocase subunit YajC [Flavobacteriales bacterium]|jgi:preprotein translocase subunit YajC|nr:preprotein translocase subunit YajC [Flavobacteriales bacterium]